MQKITISLSIFRYEQFFLRFFYEGIQFDVFPENNNGDINIK